MESVFQRVLAGAFGELPDALQRIHDARPLKQLHGRCDVERGTHWLACVLAPLASLPPTATDIPLNVTITTGPLGEVWARDFDGHSMQSRLWPQGALLAERLGAITLLFILRADAKRLEWRVAAVRCFGVHLPVRWFANARATEQIIAGRYHFDVHATLPIVGLLVRYRGWLTGY